MAKPTNLPTDAQRAVFDRYMQKWQRRLGLMDWRIEPRIKPCKSMASVAMSYEDRLAVYSVGDFGDCAITDESIEATALHELLHILLYELACSADLRLEGAMLTSAEHRVVNALEKALLQGKDA